MKRTLVALIALVNDSKKVLISKRKNSSSYKDFWEFPGGKIKNAETIMQGLVREIKEELGLSLDPNCISPLAFASDTSEKNEKILFLLICRKWEGLARNLEGQELNWVKPNRLADYLMPPPNVYLNSILRDWIN